MRTLLLDVGGGNNLSGEVEPLAEIVKTLVSMLDGCSFVMLRCVVGHGIPQE